jgi:WhiB family redox-sensing transcriptional regulator
MEQAFTVREGNVYEFTDEANCIGIDVEMFFTPEGSNTFPNERLLKLTCSTCKVKSECLDYALNHAVMGWWAGTSEIKRKQMRRQLNIIPQPIIIERATL